MKLPTDVFRQRRPLDPSGFAQRKPQILAKKSFLHINPIGRSRCLGRKTNIDAGHDLYFFPLRHSRRLPGFIGSVPPPTLDE